MFHPGVSEVTRQNLIAINVGLHPAVFTKLVEAVQRHMGLDDSKYVKADEKLAILLYYLGEA